VLTDISFEKALVYISERSDIQFNYNRDRIPINQPISINKKNNTLKDILHILCPQTATKLVIVERLNTDGNFEDNDLGMELGMKIINSEL